MRWCARKRQSAFSVGSTCRNESVSEQWFYRNHYLYSLCKKLNTVLIKMIVWKPLRDSVSGGLGSSVATSREPLVFSFDYGVAVCVLNRIPLFLRNSGMIWSH